MRRFLASLGLAATAAAVVAAGGVARPAITFCAGSQLAGSFAVVPGSAGAGNIVYRLTLRNRSSKACSLTGLPVVRLLGKNGKPLPTHGTAAHRGQLTAILATIAPGKAARATARFSPDVPGPGESTSGPCEPTAYSLRVTAPGGGTTTVPVRPPTAVCEHGTLQLSAYF